MKKKKLEKMYNELKNLPAPPLPNFNDDFLDDLHTRTELRQSDMYGLPGSYLNSGKIKWNKEMLDFIKNDLNKSYKKGLKSKDKKTLKQLKLHMDKILETIKLVKNIKPK